MLAGLHHRHDDALRFAEAAVALDPIDSLAHTTLSYTLAVHGDARAKAARRGSHG